ncbi:MAG: hypothetical protein ACRDJ1_12590 [Actinomycetota bacterium]
MKVHGGLQRRLETSGTGRALISGFIIFTLAAMLISNLPSSELRRTGMKVFRPYLDASGLHQNWNLFAPDPRRTTLQLEARITFDDGTTTVWHPPVGDPFVGVYRTFRWRKWAGNVLSSSGDGLLEPAADWIAAMHTKDGKTPIAIVLVKRSYVAPALGSGKPAKQPWQETVLLTVEYSGEQA